ncbi:MAG: FAD-dependent oxidoreductase [Treponema sp.]|jgi:fumarate reductase flavoprotein subunit|nr:FAD-dependent oxidoreductase [Treponema sp.]
MKTLSTDIVVMAAGPSGLSAAVQAAEEGAKVIVVEKAPVAGGAANMGMGPLGIGTKYQKDQMVDISVEKAFKMFMEYTHYQADANLVRKYFGMSAETIEWLENMGVQFAGAFRYFPKSEQTWHIVKTDKGIGRGSASFMVKALIEKATELGVQILFETPATDIIMENGRVTAVMARDKTGEEIRVNCKAVIVATGGAGDNPQVIKDEVGFTFGVDMFNFAIPGLKGEGIKLLRKCGAAPTQMRMEMISQMPQVIDLDPSLPAVFNQPNLMVNLLGKRFMDEEEMQNTTFTGNAIAKQKGRVGFVIFDSATLKGYKKRGLDVVSFVFNPETLDNFDEALEQAIAAKNTDVFKADTLEEIVSWCGIEDAGAFMATVDDYNEMCESVDSYFFKSKIYMKPIRKAPFYAGRIRPGAYGTLGGTLINENCEALTAEYKAIPGLYVAGTDACNIYDDSYMFLLPGNTMGFAINTGRIAGMSAAEYIQK